MANTARNAAALKGIRFTFSWSGWSSKRRFRQMSSAQRPRSVIAVTRLQGVSRNLHIQYESYTFRPWTASWSRSWSWNNSLQVHYNISQFHDRLNTFMTSSELLLMQKIICLGHRESLRFWGRILNGECCFQKKVMTLEYWYGKQFQTLWATLGYKFWQHNLLRRKVEEKNKDKCFIISTWNFCKFIYPCLSEYSVQALAFWRSLCRNSQQYMS